MKLELHMLVNYPWHSKVWLLGCITNGGAAKRLLYKGEIALNLNKLGKASNYFARAAHYARRAKSKHLEMTAVYAAALVAEAQQLMERANQYISYAATLAEPFANDGDEKAEQVLVEKERIRELMVMQFVESKLKCARIAGRLVDALTDADEIGYRAPESVNDNKLYREAQEAINTQLGYRHWLTALVMATMAMDAGSDECVSMLQRAYHIALEYPQKANFVLRGIRAKLKDLGADGEDWKLCAT